jgi:hypothetical protein
MTIIDDARPRTRGRYRTRLDAERYEPIAEVIRQHRIVDLVSLGLVLQAAKTTASKGRVMPYRVKEFADRQGLTVEGHYVVAGAAGAAAQNLINSTTARHEAAVCFVHLLSELRNDVVEYDRESYKSGDKAADLYVWRNDRRIAIEVELTQKSGVRLDRIMRSYERELQNGNVDAVQYLASKEPVANAVKRSRDESNVQGVNVADLRSWVRKALAQQGVEVSDLAGLGV